MRRAGWFFTTMVVATIGLTGCLQGEGERCQVQADCEDGLECCVRDTTEDRLIGGVCRIAGQCVLARQDAGVDEDAGAEDAAVEASTDTDGATLGDGSADDAQLDVAVQRDSEQTVDGAPGDAQGLDGALDGAQDAGADTLPGD